MLKLKRVDLPSKLHWGILHRARSLFRMTGKPLTFLSFRADRSLRSKAVFFALPPSLNSKAVIVLEVCGGGMGFRLNYSNPREI